MVGRSPEIYFPSGSSNGCRKIAVAVLDRILQSGQKELHYARPSEEIVSVYVLG